MPLGQSEREVFINAPVQSVMRAAVTAATQVGKVLEKDDLLNTLRLRTRYGLQFPTLRVDLIPQQAGTLVSVQGASDDIWGGGARKGIDKFLKALGSAMSKD